LKVNTSRNSLIYIASSIVAAAIPLITLPIFTNYLSIEQFGIYGLVQVFSIFLVGMSNFGLTTAYEREFFEYKELKDKYTLFYSIITFVLSLQLIIGLFVYLFKTNISIFLIGNANYSTIIFFSFLATAFNSLKVYFLFYFKNMHNAKLYVTYNISEITMTYSFSVIFLVFFEMGILGLFVGQLISSLFVFIILIFNFLGKIKFSLNKQYLKSALVISFPLTPKIFFGIINNQFDKYMISLLNNLGGVGIYNAAQKIANISFLIMTAVQQVYSPVVYEKMFKNNKEDAGKAIGVYLTPFMFISVFSCLLVCLFSEELIILLTPPEYHGAIKIVTILSLLYATYFFGKQPQLIYTKKTWISSLLLFISIFLNIIFNIPLILKFGALGAAYGTLFGGLISVIINYNVFQKFFFIDWETTKTIMIYLSLFVFAFLNLILFDFNFPYLYRFILKISFIAIYIYIGFYSKIILKFINDK
jgi:O-antigen/teichoic acid export membrane protein